MSTSFGGADCDTDHCLVAAKVRERLSVRKGAARKFDMRKFNLKKINEMEVRNSISLKFETGLQLWKN